MEAVKSFNTELYSLNDYKPPISKAKMTQITKAAIKAIKFYKHVVQSVEKFIQKCKPEYKVPGLYVIDSIVRQSRHQFGQEKDVFAPRFGNNIINTFQNLYRCPTDDKSKIVRVLNLWQKNKVFRSELIQPLLDMAAGIPPTAVTPVLPSTAAAVNNTPGTPATPVTPANLVQGIPDPWIAQITTTDTLAAVAQILQSPQGQQLQQLVQSLHVQQQKPQPSLLQALDAGLVVQLQALTAQLTAAAASSNNLNPLEKSASLSKKLIDGFDFGEDNDQHEEPKKEVPSALVASASMNDSLFHQLAEHLQKQNLEHLRNQFLEQQLTPKVTVQENQEALSESENSATPSQDDNHLAFLEKDEPHPNSTNIQQEDMDIEEMQDATEEDLVFEKKEEKVVKTGMTSACSKSRSRSPKKRRSRSRSGSRRRKHRKHSRSRSRERKRKTSRSYSSERRARERERERQKKGLPPIRSKTLSVCSTTLWVGQVDKKATQQDLTNVFEEFGQIESINMIPPRGCAYVCMVHRQDAYRALQKLSAGSCKIGSKIIKIAWALNKGVKTEYKQFWDVDLGITYVPWEKVKLNDLDDFAEGGMIDQETVNNDWSKQRNTEAAATKEHHPISSVPTTTVQSPVVQKSTIITQTEAYSQPVAMLQIPVASSIPAMSLVPPAFPVSMSVPPPGFSTLPPPPFMRADFNPSQPPPGFIPPHRPLHGPPPNITSISTAIPTVPRLPISVDSVKEISYGGLMLPVGSIATSATTSFFEPDSSTKPEKDKRHPPTSNINERTALNTSQSTVVSSAAIRVESVQPRPTITASVPHLSMPGKMSSMPFLDIRPGLLSRPATARFALLTPAMQPPPALRSILPTTLTTHSFPFSPGDIFTCPSIPSRLNSDISAQDKSASLPSSNIQQEGDQDYRFPPVDNLTITSESEHKNQTVANKENTLVTAAEKNDMNMRHMQDDHEPQDMAVVDFQGQEKLLESSIESLHTAGIKGDAQSLDSLRVSDLHAYKIKLGNSNESHIIKMQPQLEDRQQQFGSSPLDILPPFARHPLEIREMYGRLPPEARNHFGRLIPEGHYSRLPIESKDHYGQVLVQGRNNFGQTSVDGKEHFGKPPLEIRDHFGRLIADGGRQEHFHPDKPWEHKGDFDERPLSFPSFGGAKGFQEERPPLGSYKPELMSALGWNKGFDSDASRDFDDPNRPWERQRDRDDRDVTFQRELNGNRFRREQKSNNWIPPQPHFLEFSIASVSSQKEDTISQVNGDMSDQSKTIMNEDNSELCEQESSDTFNTENDAMNSEIESQPVVESTKTEGT